MHWSRYRAALAARIFLIRFFRQDWALHVSFRLCKGLVCDCVHTWTPTYIHAYIHEYIHVYIHKYIHT